MLEARLGPACWYTAVARWFSGLPPLRPLLRLTLLSISLFAAALLVKPPIAAAGPRSADDDQEETIRRILDLRSEAEALLESLPPETRAEVERRWRDRQPPPVEPSLPEPAEPPTIEVPTPTATLPPEVLPQPQVETPAEPMMEKAETTVDEPICGGFQLLDSDHNGLVSGADRQWRFLRLWFDNGDGQPEDDEIESLYTLGVEAIDVGLRFYTNSSGDSEDIDIDDTIQLRNVGKRGQRRRIGTLVVDSDRLARDGVVTLTDLQGYPLTGVQPLSGDRSLALAGGPPTPISCLDSE
jgi:hypothetical protein